MAVELYEFSQLYSSNCVWGSWGSYDKKQIVIDSKRHGIKDPLNGFDHINLKAGFAILRKEKQVGMKKALELTNLQLDGCQHRALNDALNVSKLLPYFFKN